MRTAKTQLQITQLDLNPQSRKSHLLVERTRIIKIIGNFAILTDKLVGKGHYGKVYQCQNLEDQGQALVCKVIDRATLSVKGEKMIKNEILNLQMIDNSDGVITLVNSVKTPSHYYIITDLCNGGDVSQLLAARGGKLPESVARKILSQVAVGLDDMHTAGVLHRDIKLPNILLNFQCPIQMPDGGQVTQEGLLSMNLLEKMNFLSEVDLTKSKYRVKIADLGFSRYLPNHNETSANLTMCGTPLYMSPQIVKEADYSAKTDIWSMGAIYYEMLTGVTPFQSKSMQ
jgi:serine/threonine-protein kinase ULK/ATG1